MQKLDLESFLDSNNVDFKKWGVGESKTLDHLLSEINSGESELQVDAGRIIRKVRGAAINVYYKNKDKVLLKLIEDRQIFNDGRERRRNIDTSIGEKMHPDEVPLETAVRAMNEELDITDVILSPIGVNKRNLTLSNSFPGLWTKNTIYLFETFLNDNQFKYEGYIEKQNDKTSYFIWKKS